MLRKNSRVKELKENTQKSNSLSKENSDYKSKSKKGNTKSYRKWFRAKGKYKRHELKESSLIMER